MEIIDLTLTELAKKIQNKEISASEAVKASLAQMDKTQDLNTVLTRCDEYALNFAKNVDEKIANGENVGALAGVPVIVKDNMSTKGIRTTCASKILDNYIPPFDATVVTKLKDAGAVIVGKANMDEFAMGSTNENSAYGPALNAVDKTRVPGGSSGGSASAVAAKQCAFALGSDTGGSIRQPASYCGVVGLKPTYSTVSRYGLVAFASSLDQIGPLTKTVEDSAKVMNVIAGYDPKDSTSSNVNVNYEDYALSVKGKRIGLAKEFFTSSLDGEVKNAVMESVKLYEKLGAEVVEVSIGSFNAALADYYVLACAEATSNLARFDGVKYGVRVKGEDYIDLYYKSRSAGFGDEVKRRIMMGNYVLSSGYYDAYYLKALKIRTAIKRDYDKAFEKCDILAGPTAPSVAPLLGRKVTDTAEIYLSDIYTVPVNIAGLPAMSIPCGKNKDGMPIGLQLIGKAFDEKSLFTFAGTYEKEVR